MPPKSSIELFHMVSKFVKVCEKQDEKFVKIIRNLIKERDSFKEQCEKSRAESDILCRALQKLKCENSKLKEEIEFKKESDSLVVNSSAKTQIVSEKRKVEKKIQKNK